MLTGGGTLEKKHSLTPAPYGSLYCACDVPVWGSTGSFETQQGGQLRPALSTNPAPQKRRLVPCRRGTTPPGLSFKEIFLLDFSRILVAACPISTRVHALAMKGVPESQDTQEVNAETKT